MNSTEEFVTLCLQGKATDASAMFDSMMRSNIADKLQERRQQAFAAIDGEGDN
jgi:pentatricopeptide repeat protein